MRKKKKAASTLCKLSYGTFMCFPPTLLSLLLHLQHGAISQSKRMVHAFFDAIHHIIAKSLYKEKKGKLYMEQKGK